jgi:hypothetical protein
MFYKIMVTVFTQARLKWDRIKKRGGNSMTSLRNLAGGHRRILSFALILLLLAGLVPGLASGADAASPADLVQAAGATGDGAGTGDGTGAGGNDGAGADGNDGTGAGEDGVFGAAGGFMPETLTLTPGRDVSEVGLTWYSDESDGDGAVSFDGDIIAATSGPATNGKIWHKATAYGLAPNTSYTYSVSNDGEAYSIDFSYKTPGAGEFTFVAVGDPQLTTGLQDSTSNLFSSDKTTRQGWADTVEAIRQKLGDSLDFITGVGDQVDLTNVATAQNVATSEQEYSNFFAPEFLRNIPIAPAVGNHDRHYGFTYHYNLPNEQAFAPLQSAEYGNATNSQYADVEAKGNYFYTYNNALFVALNDSTYPTSATAAGAVIDRFDQTLAAAVAANPNYDWLFVQHHKSTASVADHIADRDIQYYVEAGFEKLMDKYGVDFVLAGHDHVYARSYPMIGGQRGDDQGGSDIVNPNGVIYVTFTTASGLKYYELFNAAGNLYVKDNADYPYLVNGLQGSAEYMKGTLPLSNAKYLQAKKPAFTSVTVSGDQVTFETYNIDDLNTPYDAFTVTKQEGGVVGDAAKAGVRVAAVSSVDAPIEFTVSISNAEKTMAAAIEFEVDGNALYGTGVEGLGGFSPLQPVAWTPLGGGMYKGAVTLTYKPGSGESLDTPALVDIARFTYNALGLGTAAMTLTSVKLSAIVDKAPVYLPVEIDPASAVTDIKEIIVYSVYDLNKDRVVDQLDLTILLAYCQYISSDAAWSSLALVVDRNGGDVTPSMCDFNGDGRIDMLDLVELYVNYTK